MISVQQLIPQSTQFVQQSQQSNRDANRGGAPPGSQAASQSSNPVASFSKVLAGSGKPAVTAVRDEPRTDKPGGSWRGDSQLTEDILNSDPIGKAIEELSNSDAANSDAKTNAETAAENPIDDGDTIPADSDDLVAAFLAAIALPAQPQDITELSGEPATDAFTAELNPQAVQTTEQIDIPTASIESIDSDFASILEGINTSAASDPLSGLDVTDNTDVTAWMPTNTSTSEEPEPLAPLAADAVQSSVVDLRGLPANPVSRPLENENEITATDKSITTGMVTLDADAEPLAVQAVQQSDTAQSDTAQSDASDEQSRGSSKDAELKTDPSKLDLTAKQLETDNRPIFTLESVDAEAATNVPIVRPADLYDKIVESAAVVRTDGVDKITLQLTPEHLGRVEVQLSLSEQGLTLKVSTEDAGVRGMLNSQLSQLISSLSDKGLKVVGAEVVYSGLAGDAFKERSDNQQGGTKQQSQSQRRYTAAADISATSAAFAYQAYFDADEEVTEFIA